MTATLVGGVVEWSMTRDEKTYRDYVVTHYVDTDSTDDGPYTVMNCSGLPQIGDTWNFGNDNDVWAFCTADMEIKNREPVKGEPSYSWEVKQKFTTRPLSRCSDTLTNDPLAEPQKVSGSFVRYGREVRFDRNGNPIITSALTPVRGSEVEFDANRATVAIEQNVSSLALSTFANMVNTVNSSTLWGMPARCVKLSASTWERKYYGTCSVYYTRKFEFDIDGNGFDRIVGDFSEKVIRGKWDKTNPSNPVYVPDPLANRFNPMHFQRYTDANGNPSEVLLNGFGAPANTLTMTGTNAPGEIRVEYYSESDFTILGIPTTL